MPFKSRSQWKAFFAMEKRGELPKGTAERWAKETKVSFKSLPKRTISKRKLSERNNPGGKSMAKENAISRRLATLRERTPPGIEEEIPKVPPEEEAKPKGASGKIRQAIDILQTVVELNPDDQDTLNNIIVQLEGLAGLE